VGDGVTLGELGLDSLMGVEIKQLLERDYAVALSAKEIRALTVAGLRSIGSPSASKQPQPSQQGQGQSSGAKATGPAVDATVALVPKMGLVPMNELATTGSGASKGNALFVVHPIEGTVDALRPLMGRVTCAVYGLQCTADAPLDSVSTLASHYIQVCMW
jgi:fatty acid synthase